MRGYLSETSPEYKQVVTELAALETQMEKIEKDDSNSIKNPNDYLDKYRDFKYHETLYELLIRQFDAAKLDESREGNVMQIVDYAVIPERKSKPKRAVITLLSGFTFGMLLLLFLFAQRKWQAAQLNPEFAEKLMRLKVSSKLALTRKKY